MKDSDRRGKRLRLAIIGIFCVLILAASLFENQLATRNLDHRAETLSDRLSTAYRSTSLRQVAALDTDARVGGSPVEVRRLSRFLDRSGSTPFVFRKVGGDYEARFKSETWGRSVIFRVLWSPGGTVVERL
ncbi:MAG: hypothetical protein JWN46_702 [Acidimicrobiales bacterium]|nr:hypothetical protein [Acidimicrobiales bacterium]